MVNVAVGINYRDNRFLTAVFKVKIHPDFGRFCRDQRVNDGDAFFTFNNGHVRQIEVTNLVNAIRYFKQPADVDQLRLTPQARVYRIRGFVAFFDERILLRIPDNISLFAFDHVLREWSDKAFVGVGKVGVIGEGQLVVKRVVGLLRGGSCVFRGFSGHNGNRKRCE